MFEKAVLMASNLEGPTTEQLLNTTSRVEQRCIWYLRSVVDYKEIRRLLVANAIRRGQDPA